MKYILFLTAISLSLTLPAYAMAPQTALIAKLKDPMEGLKDLSDQMQQQQTAQQLMVTKFEGLETIYATLIKQETDEKTRQLLAYTMQNFIQCREMLDEDRQNTHFWFFNPAWNSEDDDAREEIDENAFFQDIKADTAGIGDMLEGAK